MGWWHVGADTLASSRFVISPLAETTACLLKLEEGTAAHPGEHAWLDAHRAAYQATKARLPVITQLLRESLARHWVPGFIAVAPSGSERRAPVFADELVHVARTAQLSQSGWVAALAGMRPNMRWLGEGRLQINAYDKPPREISGAQLLFVPVTPQTGWVAWDEPTATPSCTRAPAR